MTPPPLMPSLCFQAFYYPKEAGLAFGGPGSSRYLRLEIHYHNPLVFKGEWGGREDAQDGEPSRQWGFTSVLQGYDLWQAPYLGGLLVGAPQHLWRG